MLERLALGLFLLAFLAAPAFSANEQQHAAQPPSRASLVAFWETTVENDPHVQLFEKTKEEGVYGFQTDFFPYKGKLKLLNAAVSEYDSQYYQGVYRGIIEVELPDADDDFFKKYARSYGAWAEDLNYYYNPKKGIWFKAGDWDANVADLYTASGAPSSQTCAATGFWVKNSGTFIPIGVFVIVIAALLAFARKQNKRIWANHAKALEEQQRGLKMVEESQRIAKESLKLQETQTQLLAEIATSVRKK